MDPWHSNAIVIWMKIVAVLNSAAGIEIIAKGAQDLGGEAIVQHVIAYILIVLTQVILGAAIILALTVKLRA